jgi:hypothetical protein
MAIRKTFSFSDWSVVARIEEQDNESQYIARLVREDIARDKEFITKADVVKLIEDKIKGLQLVAVESRPEVDEDVMNSALSLVSF